MTSVLERTIVWKDTKEEQTVEFGIGDFLIEFDHRIFYWVEKYSDIYSLRDKNGAEDFYIKD